MISPWMIDEVERRRRERELREQPSLRIELPVRTDEDRPARGDERAPIVIDILGA